MAVVGPAGRQVGGPPRVAVRLVVWGEEITDQERAVWEASQGWGRRNWEFVAIERLVGTPCPLSRYDPKSIAGDAGFGWAYLAYRADR